MTTMTMKRNKTFSNSTNKVKTKTKKTPFKSLKDAYDMGYKIGWDEAHKIPNKFGARYSATKGFGKGVRNRYRTDNYVGKYKGNKYGK